MNSLIHKVLTDLCDINTQDAHHIANTLTVTLDRYFKARPSLKMISITDVYRSLAQCGTINNITADEISATIYYESYDPIAISKLNGLTYSTPSCYPMYVNIVPLDKHFVYMRLLSSPSDLPPQELSMVTATIATTPSVFSP